MAKSAMRGSLSITTESIFAMAPDTPIHHTTGGHYVMKRQDRRVTVPYHNKNLKRGTLASIIWQAGLTVEQFTGLL